MAMQDAVLGQVLAVINARRTEKIRRYIRGITSRGRKAERHAKE